MTAKQLCVDCDNSRAHPYDEKDAGKSKDWVSWPSCADDQSMMAITARIFRHIDGVAGWAGAGRAGRVGRGISIQVAFQAALLVLY